MKILAIETSCDETSAAIVESGTRVLAEVTATQMDIHARFGGVVPEVASRHHVEDITRVTGELLTNAGLGWSDIDAIAVTCGPGLLGSLLVGVSAAKGYALATGKPLIGVHHIAGHVAAATINHLARPPFLCLVVSGGHTELLVVDEQFHFSKLGGTRDDAAGEAYDKVARLLGLAYPGGPKVDEYASQGDMTAYSFPRALLDDDAARFDFSFSGLKSAVNNALTKQRNRNEPIVVEDVCASFQAAVIDVLVEKTLDAARFTGLRQVVVAGGVAANRGLRQRMLEAGQAAQLDVVFPPLPLCTDNASMIGAAAYYRAMENRYSGLDLNAYAQLSLATWQDQM